MDAAQPQIGQQLRLMDRQESLNSFDFDDDETLDSQIDTVSGIDLDALVDQRENDLRFDREPELMQLPGETHLVCTFEQAWPKSRVHLDCTLNNCAGEFVDLHRSVGSVCPVVSFSVS